MRFRLANRADWQRLRDYVGTLPWQREDGTQIRYRVTVEELRSTRSIEQNARYWALVTAISKAAPDFMGGEHHQPEVWHEYLAQRFLGMESGPFGHGVRKSTARLKVGEFAEYMTEVEIWAQGQFPGWTFGWEDAA